jgi:hypothetical protein
MVPTRTGKLKRCTEDCSKYKKFRSGTHFSIERMQENGMDTADQKADVEEALMYSELLNALMDLLDTLDPDKRAICQAIMDGKKDKDADAELGYAASSSYNYHKQKLLESLKERLKDYRKKNHESRRISYSSAFIIICFNIIALASPLSLAEVFSG